MNYTITKEQLDTLKQLAAKQQFTKDFLLSINILEAVSAKPVKENNGVAE